MSGRKYKSVIHLIMALFVLGLFQSKVSAETAAPTATPNPILFVTQVPIPADFVTVGAVIGGHDPALSLTGRGGDLWIRYTDGTLKNLTETAGYGNSGFQGANSISVRDPHVHWDGQKALFSMVVGATENQYEWELYQWQLYEITGLGLGDTPVITKVPNQPANRNNISPIYATDDQIIFASDRTRNGEAHLYPQLDEYESVATVTGLWKLNPATGNLQLLNHAPSGDFTPFIDSFGRVVFTQWDHLQRDQQTDSDAFGTNCYNNSYSFQSFNWSDESAASTPLNDVTEVYPEPRECRNDLLAGTNLVGHTINHFFPWMMNEDGTEIETLNHIGRQELHAYVAQSMDDDPNLVEYYGQYARFNPNSIENMLHIEELPLTAGTYIGTDAPEFYTHSGGLIFTLNGAPSVDGDHMQVTYLTHPDTADFTASPSADHSGLYRDPLPMSDGSILVTHTSETNLDDNIGTRPLPQSRYDFQIKPLVTASNGYQEAGAALVSGGISKTISYWDPDVLVSYSGQLWEWQPVEVKSRPRPTTTTPTLPAIEQAVFDQVGVNLNALQIYMRANDLALLVTHDVTSRDDLDFQQPFNIRVENTTHQTIGASGTIYDVAYMQFFQGDQIRSYYWDGTGSPPTDVGRRVIAQEMHDSAALASNPASSGPAGSVTLGTDGSMAAFVPASRALSWQMTDGSGVGVVRERYWLTFQPGEVRVCASCHGLNEDDQAGGGVPTNSPQALIDLLIHWDTQVCDDASPAAGCAVPTNTTLLPVVSNNSSVKTTLVTGLAGIMSALTGLIVAAKRIGG